MSADEEPEWSLENLVALARNEIDQNCGNENVNANKTSPKVRQLKTFDILSETNIIKLDTNNSNGKRCGSIANYSGFSDDEDNPVNLFESEYEQDIKRLLKKDESGHSSSSFIARTTNVTENVSWKTLDINESTRKPQQKDYTDFFGIKVVKPLISSTMLKMRMADKNAVGISRLQTYTLRATQDKNWVVAGVIVGKGPVKTSQNGKKFVVWTLSDLVGNLETAGVFLFGSAFQDLWKTTIGTVIAILNPDIMENTKKSKDKATLKIVSADRVLILGHSKDYGICKHKKNNGEPCSSFVNVSNSEFCIYHLKQAYQNCCKRSEFQSSSRGLTALRNKVLGKNEVFYAGKSYTAIPAKKNAKQVVKDNFRLKALTGNITSPNPLIKNKKTNAVGRAVSIDAPANQRQTDLLELQKLGWKPNTVQPASNSCKQKDTETLQKLGLDSETTTDEGIAAKKPEYIDLNVDFKKAKKTTLNAAALTLLTGNKIVLGTDPPKPCSSRFDRAKQQAISYIKKNGPLSKEDPNCRKNIGNKKRSLDEQDVQGLSKKMKISLDSAENSFASERFKKMMALTSKHVDLLEQYDDEEQEKYFSKLELKERLEEKMLNTLKVPCKAVKCLKCKYTSFSAADRCKEEKHPLRVFDSYKRFFKCGKCGNRTVSLEIVPLFSCKRCGSGKWEKTSMMKEQKTDIVTEKLSIRGDELKFINSNTNDANLNLMVPDEN